jgi:ketosteroid isomerase-like protein
MSATTADHETETPDALARRFLDSLQKGRVVDALEALAPDAVLTEPPGKDRHGLREIAESLRPYRTPDRLAIDQIESEGDEVSALVRVVRKEKQALQRYRANIVVRRGRIASVRFSPA